MPERGSGQVRCSVEGRSLNLAVLRRGLAVLRPGCSAAGWEKPGPEGEPGLSGSQAEGEEIETEKAGEPGRLDGEVVTALGAAVERLETALAQLKARGQGEVRAELPSGAPQVEVVRGAADMVVAAARLVAALQEPQQNTLSTA
jgi:hypothetical protein